MEFRVLGPLEVTTEDGAVDVGTGKRRALLAHLLIHANEVVSAERLIDELWGEHPPATAAKSVQVYVSQLRKALPANGEVLATRGSGYVIKVAPDQLDARLFEQRLATAQQALADGDPRGAAKGSAIQDLRSPDARIGDGVATYMPSVTSAPQVVSVPATGFQWGDAGIGAAVTLGLIALCGGALLVLSGHRRERRLPPAIG